MGHFDNVMIGKVDINDVQLKEGDKIEVEICKPSAVSHRGVYLKGIIIYSHKDMAYAIKEDSGRVTPLCNFAPKCEFKKI